MDSSSAGTSGLAGAPPTSGLASAKKRTKVVFLNPVEITNWDQIKENSKQNVIGENDFINYEKMLKDDDAASVATNNSGAQKRQSKKRGRPKGSRNGARKRPIDPSQPWLESSDSDNPNIGLEDELDDDEYFRRLEEEKMREDAEEESRKKREMEAKAAARGRGRRGSVKGDVFMNHQYQILPGNSDSCHSSTQRELSGRNKRQGSYAALAGFTEPSDSEDFSELDDKASARSGFLVEYDCQKSLDDIHEQNEEEYQQPASPFRQSVLDMLPSPPSPSVPLNTDEVKSGLKCEHMNAPASTDLNTNNVRMTVTSNSFNDPHTLKMLEMDPIELRFRAPPLILPSSANDLVCSREYFLDALSIYEVLRRYGSLLRLSPFRLEDFLASLISDENSNLLAEAHIVLLKALLREDEANGTSMCPVDCKDSVNMTFYLLDRFNWPYLLASYLSSVKSGEAAARVSAINTTTANGSIGGPTGSGGADIVLTAALFPSDLIPLDPDYPFVPMQSRIAVLRGLTNLFLATGSVRGDILREGLMAHEDYCRVCHQSGEVLCCDGCTAVFHLHCLNPPLSSIPTTSWICPVCIKKRTPGVTDCLSEAEKNGVAHYQEPIGKDRAGRLYWYISRRLIIEPVDFTQREPELMGFHDGVVDKLWESEYGHELAENDPEVKDGNDEDDDDVDDSITNRNDNDINSSSKVSGSDNLSVSVKRSLKRKNKKYQCDPSISYANEPRVYYYSSIEQVMRIRESLSTDWEPWLCHRLDALLPKMRNEMAITQKLTENGLQQFCRSRPNHKSISVNDPVQSYNTMPVTNTVYVYSVLEVEQASCEKSTLLKHDNEICDYPKKKLAIAACSLPSMDAPVFPTLPNELPSVMEKCSEDFPTILLVTDQNNCVIRNHDGVVNCTTRDNSNDVATYPPTILEPHELSTLHMTVDSSPSNSSEGLLAYRLSDEGSWRSWTNLYTSGVWIGQESITDEKLEDGLNELKRTPSGTRNSNPQNTTGEVDGDEITSESVNVALTRAQHMEEKEKRRLLTNKFNFSELSSDLWQYIDPASLASTYKGILRFMDNKIELSKFPAFERIRFDCWPASPYQLLDLLRLTLCYMESKIPLAFLTPAWRTHRADWIKDVLDSKSPSELAFVLARLEASIRSVCFQRVWFSSLGHLNLERMTAAQREEDKRLRQFDRFSSTASGTANSANLPTTLIRTKTPHPIRHTVWKTRGEEYRRLGGDGWIWLSSTRSNASQMAQHALLIRPPVSSWRQSDVVELPCGITSRSTVHHPADCRGLQHGIGWGVCPEYLQGQTAVKPPKASECRGHVLHPITGIPLYLNPKRTPYTIPPNVLRNLNAQISESCTDYQTNSSQTHDKKENVITSTSVAIKNEESINNVTTIEKKEGDQLDSTKDAESKKVEVKVEQKELLLGQVTSNKSNNNKNKLEEDANPVLNVSYCISNRIHFPPAVHQPQTTYSHTSSSRRLHFRLDSLLKHRYIAAENDKKAGLAASNAVSKLVKEIEELEKRHSEIMERLTNLGNEAQQARTAKAQAVKAKQNALLAKPLPVEHARNPHMNQSSEHGNTAVGRQLIQQSVLTDQGVCYRVLAPRNVPNMQINQFAYNPARRTTNIPSRSSNSHPSRRPRARRGSDFSNSDSDSFPASARRMDTSNKESLPVRRSARRVRTVRHDPDFVVDFDEDDEDDDRNKADDSDGFDPSDETRGRHGGQKRSQVSVHLNARTSGRGIPQYDGVGDTSDEDIGYDDDDDDDYDNEYDELEEDEIVEEDYDDEVVEDYGDEIVEDEEIEEEEDEQEEEDEIEEDECFPVTSGKRIRLAPQVMEKMSKVSVHHSGQSPNPSTVCTTPKVVILKNNTTPNMQGNNNKARILSIPATGGQRIILPAKMNGPNSGEDSITGISLPAKDMKEDGQVSNLSNQPTNLPQGLRLVRIVRNADGGTNIVPLSASDIIPKTVESNANNKTAESQITVSLTGTEQESASKLNPSDGIRVILNSNNGLSNVVNLPKSSVVPTDLHEIQPTIMYASFPSVSVGNESVNTPLQPITISTASSQVGFRLTDLITPVTVSNPVLLPSSHQPLTVNICSTDKLKTPTANTAVRFVIAPTANSLGLTNSTQMPTVTVVKASNQSDLPTDSTKVASTTSSLPPLLPRKPPAILRRTLAGPSPSLLLSVSSSNDQIVSQPMRAPSVASLVATNTARQLVCGGFNRYIPTGPARPMISDSSTVLDPQQGRRSISKAQLTRNTPLVDEDPRFLSDPKVFVSEYQGTFRQFVPTVKLQTPIIDEAARALDRAVAEANAKLESINAQMASVRSDAHGLETQIKSLKSELSKYQEIVNRISPAVSAPYSLSLYNSADFDLNNKAFVNKFFRCNKKTNIADVPEDSDSHLAVLPKSLPFVNSYSWPENDCVQSQSFNDKQKQNIVIPKSNLFRLNPRNLRLAILFAGRREIPGYDVEKKRLSQVNWLYPSSRPNFAECWRFRLSQIRIGRCGRDNISFGLDLANFALLLRTLWHCIRWDDILAEPEEDSHTLDSSGRPCFKKTLNHEDDDDNDDNVGGGFSGRQDDMPYSVRRIVEIQPLDRFWLQANYKLRITTTRPNRSYAGRRRKAAGISDHSVRGRSARGSSLHDSPEFEESAPRRKGRRTGQKNGQTGKDPDYDPAVDEGWRVGIPCSTTSGRRQPRNNGRSYGRSNRGSFYDSEDDDQNGDFNSSRRGFQSQRHEVTVEEKWMSEDAVFPWEIRVFMNALLPPKSSYPPVDNNSDSKADYSRKNQYIISARLASLPPGPSPDESNTTAMQNNLVLSSANTECCMEKDGFLYGQSKAVVSNSTSSRRSALASALQFGRTPGSSRNRTDEHSINNIPRPLSPNTLEAKARARSIAATNAARASVAARRARFERALLEQRVRSLKSQFCSRKRLIFNWAKSLADIAVNEIKGAHLGTKTEQPIEDPVEVEQKTLHHIAKKSTVRRGRPPVSRPKSPTILQKKKPGRPKSTVHNDSKNALNNKKSKRKISSISSLSSGEENVNPDSDPLTDYTDAGDQEIEPEWTPAGPTSHLKSASNRPPRKSALNHEFIKSTKNSALKTIQSVKCPDRSSKASLAIKASLKESNKSLASEKDSDVTSCCSTPSTSPGLGDYDNCQQKSEVISQKSVVKDRASQSYPKKTKKSRHESSNSDASGRNDNVSVRVKSPHSSSAGGSNRGRGGGGGRRRGRPKSTDESDKNEAPSELTVNIPRSVPSSPSSAAYCICKTPYDPLREYIGCDLCRDWFHFECVGLDSKDADKLGDSWHCPDCKQAELQANEMLYCVCRTPYEPTRVYIACDGCDEWYHPECVGLTPEEAVNHPDTYLCPACRESSQRKSSITTKKLSGRSKKSKLSSSDEAEYTDQPGANTIYATHLTSDRIEGLVNLIEEIKKHKMSWPFITTPDPVKFPVAQSLDDAFNLPSVISNLKTGVYKTLGDFSFDMNRLFASSRLIYPKDTPEFNCTEIVEALFVQKMKQFKETL